MTTVKIEYLIGEEENQLRHVYISGTCEDSLRKLWSLRLQEEPFKDFDNRYNELVRECNGIQDTIENLLSQKKFFTFKKNRQIKKQARELQESVNTLSKKFNTDDYSQSLMKQKIYKQIREFLTDYKAALIFQAQTGPFYNEIWAVEDF